jgi:hypothetical protein
MFDTSRGRRRFVIQANFAEIGRKAVQRGECPTFWTCTDEGAADVNTPVAEFKRKVRNLKQMLGRRIPGLLVYGVIARQPMSGRWHMHGLVDRYLPESELKRCAQKCGLGSFQNLQCVGDKIWGMWRPSVAAVRKMARYVASYAEGGHNCYGLASDAGVRRVIVMGKGARSCTNRFKWSRGVGALFSAGLWRMKQLRPHYCWWKHRYSEVHRNHIIDMGWKMLSEESKKYLLDVAPWAEENPESGVREWWYKGDDPRIPF